MTASISLLFPCSEIHSKTSVPLFLSPEERHSFCLGSPPLLGPTLSWHLGDSKAYLFYSPGSERLRREIRSLQELNPTMPSPSGKGTTHTHTQPTQGLELWRIGCAQELTSTPCPGVNSTGLWNLRQITPCLRSVSSL